MQALDGIGKGISGAIAEIGRTGAYGPLEELRRTIPPAVIRFTDLPGVGAKTALRLYEALGVTTLDELRAAAEAGRIAGAKGLGPRVERTVRAGLAELASRDTRVPLGAALPAAARLLEQFRERTRLPALIVGSARRYVEAVGDVDLLAAAADPAPVLDAFAALPWRCGRSSDPSERSPSSCRRA